jgi:argininosuccinate lyase
MTRKISGAVYKDTVLAPLFEGVKRHHWRYQMRINRGERRAARRMRAADGDEARAILGALDDISRPSTREPRLHGRARGFLLLRRRRAHPPLGVEVAGKLHTGRSRNDIDHTVFKLALKDRLARSRRAPRDDRGVAARWPSASANHRRRVHARPAGATDDLRHYLAAFIELSLRDMDRLLHAGAPSICAAWARRRSPRRASGSIASAWPTAGICRRAGKLLRLHRRRRLRHGRVRGAQARLHPRGRFVQD